MPGAGNSADDRRLRCCGKLCGRCGKVCCQSCILHTNFDGNGSLFGGIHTNKFSCSITKQITKSIVKKNSYKDYSSGLEELRALGRYHTTNNTRQPQYCHTRHNFL